MIDVGILGDLAMEKLRGWGGRVELEEKFIYG